MIKNIVNFWFLKKLFIILRCKLKIYNVMKFKAVYSRPGASDYVIGVFNTRDEAVRACVDYKDGSYCLDSREERLKCFEHRNYCICGCGPDELSIEEVE